VRRPRRRPREVYRVYSEDEYLNGAESEPATVGETVGEEPVAAEPATKDLRERRLRRMAGVAMLAGAVGTVAGVVVANSSWGHRGAGRRPGSLVASTRSSLPVSFPASSGARAAPPGPAVTRPYELTRSRVARTRRRRDMSSTHPPIHLPTDLRAGRSVSHPPTDGHPSERIRRGGYPSPSGPPPAEVGVHRGGGVAIVLGDSSGSSPGRANVFGGAASPTTAASSVEELRPPAARAGAGLTEFGFER